MASASTASNACNRKIAIALAFTGAFFNPFPLVWLHKFYLGQYFWGVAYLVLDFTRIPQVACCFEGIWYLMQSDESFAARFPRASAFVLPDADSATGNNNGKEPINQSVRQTAQAIRELERLREEGLITEHEFEQKRRKLLNQV